MLYDADECLLDRRVYVDAALYEQEQDSIFARCWLFAGHEALLREDGSYLTMALGEAPVIVWRQTGVCRVFLNACPLSGRRLCYGEEGSADAFECSCHGWVYRADGGPDGVAPLIELRQESYRGLLFANFAGQGPSLAEYLGEFAFYLDMFTDSPGEVAALGPVQSIAATNWKVAVDGCAGGWRNRQQEEESRALLISCGPGFVFGGWQYEDGKDRFIPRSGALFPNLVISWETHGLTLIQPRGPGSCGAWSIHLAESTSGVDERRRRRLAFQREFAAGSPAFAEMAANWEEVTRIAASPRAQTIPVSFAAGRGQERFHEDLPGLLADAWNDLPQRSFYQLWRQSIEAAVAGPP